MTAPGSVNGSSVGPAVIPLAIQRRPRQAEIEQLGVAAIGHEDVRRLDVAVDDPFGVRGFERIGELHAELEDSIRRQRAASYELLQ
jgi:hypothetical protein